MKSLVYIWDIGVVFLLVFLVLPYL